MKKFIYCLLALSIISCSKSNLVEDIGPIETKAYFLDFDIKDDLYSMENQTSYEVHSEQDLDHTLIFMDAYRSTHKYPYFGHDNTPEDSVDIIGTIKFDAKEDFGFEENLIHFEIIVREAISNLTEVSDSTYTYNSNLILYNQLLKNNFGQKNLFGGNDLSSIFITMPSHSQEQANMFHYMDTSNGFYFEHENITFTEIEHNEEENTINLNGNFVVELKQMSCGFYSTHLIENADFKLIIK